MIGHLLLVVALLMFPVPSGISLTVFQPPLYDSWLHHTPAYIFPFVYVWIVSALGLWLYPIAVAFQHLILDEHSGDCSAHLMRVLAVDMYSVLEELHVPESVDVTAHSYLAVHSPTDSHVFAIYPTSVSLLRTSSSKVA